MFFLFSFLYKLFPTGENVLVNREELMLRALELAYMGIGHTKSNPMVGCVIEKFGEIIGEGWHKEFGGPHAEVNAILNAESRGESVEGANLVVTLEPCFHEGKTPPCVDLLIEKQIKSVAVLFRDPNPLVAGRSIEKLKARGIPVDESYDILKKEFSDFYEEYFYFMETGTPFTALKLAMDSNRYIATHHGTRTEITGEESNFYVHFLRQKYDAILTGAQTVMSDNPQLGVRHGDFPGGRRDPLRILLDPNLRLSINLNVFRDENFLVVTTEELRRNAEQIYGSRVETASLLPNRTFDLWELLGKLSSRGIPSVLVEGGKATADEFIAQEALQKGYFFVSDKKLVFGQGLPGIDFLRVPSFHLQKKSRFGEDTLWEGFFDFTS